MAAVLIFLAAVAVIVWGGIRMTRVADHLADQTGMGEAMMGALLLGGATSMPGIITTTVAAYDSLPTLAVSNAVGGIAVQTVWLVVADLVWRRANLEHVAASPENMLQGALLISLLTLPLLAMSAPPVTIGGFLHPVSIALAVFWVFGMRMVRKVRKAPMWKPTMTPDTVPDEPGEPGRIPPGHVLWRRFVFLALLLGAGGYALARSGSAIIAQTPLSESLVGGAFTATASSLPELIVVIAGVRAGAYTLAVGNIIGGNAFDTLFLVFADAAYTGGSIYHAVSSNQRFFLVLTILMTAILLMGMLRRERVGWWRIGFEGVLILASYLAAIAALVLMN